MRSRNSNRYPCRFWSRKVFFWAGYISYRNCWIIVLKSIFGFCNDTVNLKIVLFSGMVMMNVRDIRGYIHQLLKNNLYRYIFSNKQNNFNSFIGNIISQHFQDIGSKTLGNILEKLWLGEFWPKSILNFRRINITLTLFGH